MSLSFGTTARAYDRGRPEYPADAVTWLLGDARDVADIGAGTGKLTAVIRDRGRRVVAVEPDSAMRDLFKRAVPDVKVLDGAGERIPLPDQSIDAITFGQAWHWVHVRRACEEADRVLRPSGLLGLVWNVRDQSSDWVDQLTKVAHAENGEARALVDIPPFEAPFQQAENRRWNWSRRVTPAEVVALIASRSSVITASDSERNEILDAVRHLLARHPDTAGRDSLELPYVTTAWRITR